MSLPEIGSTAPEIELQADGGETVAISALHGKQIVLYFYPKDDTSGCTTEAIDFSSLLTEFDKQNTIVLGVSPDGITKHEKFKKKHDLTVRLLADEDHSAALAYGVWAEKSMYGKTYMGIVRSTFLIDKEGKIAEVWTKVKVKEHAQAVLEAARALNAN